MSEEMGQRGVKLAYTIVQREKDGKKFWVRVGAAFVNRDGSLSVRLDATPVNGQLHIRDYHPAHKTVADKGEAA
jgi:hypothetical protein